MLIDTDAEGNPIVWVTARLRDRLGPMLAAAGGGRVAELLDPDTIRAAVDQIETLLTTDDHRGT